jgi:mono/diheme cytochrome c family protein
MLGTLLASLLAAGACAEERGAVLYAQHCAVCHQPGGEGIPGYAPRIAGTLTGLAESQAGRAYLASLVVSGMAGPIVAAGQKFNDVMPGFAALSDDELAAVLAHVLGALNKAGPEARVAPAELAAARGRALPPAEVRRLRGR